MLQMLSWHSNKIDKCDYCENKAEYYLHAFKIFSYAERCLCEEHMREWTKGDLYI